MKKKKVTLKKLTLNKNTVSKLGEGQVSGGTIVSGFGCPATMLCPVTINNCPSQNIFCPGTLNCPPDTLVCPITANCPPLTIDCSFNGCGSFVDACPTALGCFQRNLTCKAAVKGSFLFNLQKFEDSCVNLDLLPIPFFSLGDICAYERFLD